ncbi:DUF6694 family lipoprotein [Pedobacter sp. GSP4]|uniref:DUF6694 family lipoprotein n=1 Tax=Pedobacter sp. GSP4 TaxID=3453716 RepID=UPI003EEC5E6B
MNKIYIAILLCTVMGLTGCREKFQAKSEKEFEVSKAKIVKTLDQDERTNLEKALRVIALTSMRLKWNEPDKYKGKSFDKISLEMIDGLSYASVISLAENLLQQQHKKEIEKASAAIDTLEIQKKALLKDKSKLNIFKITSLYLSEDDFFDVKVPKLEIEYTYVGKQALMGNVEVTLEIREISTKKVIASQIWSDGDGTNSLNPGDSMNGNVILRQAKENNPTKWNAVKYPVAKPKLADYDLELKLFASSITINGKTTALPNFSVEDIDAEIQKKKAELKEVQDTKGTLDELVLTGR